MMRIVNALQVVAADDVPEIADAELGIEFDEGMMRFRHDRPTGQLEFEVLHHFRGSRLYVSRCAPGQLRHWRCRYRVVAVIADRKPRRIRLVQPDSDADYSRRILTIDRAAGRERVC